MNAPLSILIVEDNPGDLLLLQEHLRFSGIPLRAVRTATTLAAATALLAEEVPDLVLLDMFLPDSSGLDTFHRLSAIAPDLPVVVLSGLSDAQTAISTIQQGAQDYIVKGDFDERLLAKVLQYALERNAIRLKLQASIERYTLVAKATSDVLWDWNLVTDANWFSENFTVLFGYPPGEVGTGIDAWKSRVHPDDSGRVIASIHQAIAEGRRFWEDEYRFRKADGTYAAILDRGHTLYNEQGVPTRMIGSMQDISTLKKLQDTILREQVAAQRLIAETTVRAQEKERATLGRDLHDNINQILTACKLMIDMAAGSPDLRDSLLPRSASHLNRAIEEIRRLSRELVPPEHSAEGIGPALAELAEAMSGSRHIDLVLEGPIAAIPPDVQLTLYRITQEALNNISKYAGATEASISLHSSAAGISLTVADNGAGFDPEERKLGIGLRNIRHRAELHGGSLRIDTAPGTGCRLIVRLPPADRGMATGGERQPAKPADRPGETRLPE
ncbi:MAG: response regulator [Chitinophagaceae bacterium]|nr:MAG: response regulator [Chitinophagaceae bacterium]